jgi:hypothetical protein
MIESGWLKLGCLKVASWKSSLKEPVAGEKGKEESEKCGVSIVQTGKTAINGRARVVAASFDTQVHLLRGWFGKIPFGIGRVLGVGKVASGVFESEDATVVLTEPLRQEFLFRIFSTSGVFQDLRIPARAGWIRERGFARRDGLANAPRTSPASLSVVGGLHGECPLPVSPAIRACGRLSRDAGAAGGSFRHLP